MRAARLMICCLALVPITATAQDPSRPDPTRAPGSPPASTPKPAPAAPGASDPARAPGSPRTPAPTRTPAAPGNPDASRAPTSPRAPDAAPRPTPARERAPGDSLARSLAGVWVSDADPTGAVTINAEVDGAISIWADKRFRCLGFFDGADFVGITRAPGWGPGPYAFGGVRIRTIGPGRISADFADDLRGASRRNETWSFKGKYGEDARKPPPPTSGGDALPKLGEYVYVEELPEAVERVPPDYPDWARRKGVSGTVVVQALVGKDGLVKDTRLVTSVPELDDYAVAAVKQWKFRPATAKGAPVAVWVAVPVKFTLH